MLTVLCSICLCVSFAIAICAVVNFIVSLYKKSDVKDQLGKRGIITPFHLLVLGIFLAVMVALLPAHVYQHVEDSGWEIAFKAALLSAQNALQLFTINASFDNISAAITTANGLHPALVHVYTLYLSIYFIVAPMLTAAFVLSFVKGLYENWRYFKNKRVQELHVFSELNENSLTLAKNIIFPESGDEAGNNKNKPSKTPAVNRMIVFTNITQKMQEEKSELVSAAKAIGAICLQKDITDVYLKDPKNKQMLRKLYLISLDENENTSKAMQLIAQCHKDYNNDTTHIYVFANSDESGILLDSVVTKLSNPEKKDEKQPASQFNIKVRRVNEKRNLVWNTLRLSEKDLGLELSGSIHSGVTYEQVPLIFSRAKEKDAELKDDTKLKDGEKLIEVLIVGMGQYGTELLKTICWYCQMPGYRLHVHVFDGLANCEGKVQSIAPDFVRKNHVPAEEEAAGEAYYDIDFCNEKIDVREASFAKKIEKLTDISLAFVTLGNDNINIDTAIKLRRLFGKIHAKEGFKVPPILTVVYDSEKAENLEYGKQLKNDSRDGDYNIRFIGDVKHSYSPRNIEQSELESIGLACHMHWAEINNKQSEDKEKKRPTLQDLKANWQQMEKDYNTYEYNRRSSMAQAMHLMARKLVCNSSDEETLKRNEHNRWNVYVRADGYTVSPEIAKNVRLKKDTIAKIHPDLVTFAELPDETKAKDAMPDYTELLKDYQEKSEFFASIVDEKK